MKVVQSGDVEHGVVGAIASEMLSRVRGLQDWGSFAVVGQGPVPVTTG